MSKVVAMNCYSIKRSASTLMILTGAALNFVIPFTAAGEETKPPLPQFRSLATDEQISQAMEDSKTEEMLKGYASADGTYPEYGALVGINRKGSNFLKLGIPVGSVLLRSKQTTYWTYPLAIERDVKSEEDEPDYYLWVSHDNQIHRTPIPEGNHQTYIIGHRNMPNWYLHHGKRNPKWDRMVLLALLQQGKNTSLAESCWARAIDQGYRPDGLTYWCGMMLALTNGELERAEAFADLLLPMQYPQERSSFPIMPKDMARLALITGNAEWFRCIREYIPEDNELENLFKNYMLQADIADEVPADTPPPSELAKNMERTSFLMAADTSATSWSNNGPGGVMLYDRAATAHHKGKDKFPEFHLNVKLAHFCKFFFSPSEPSQDIDVEIKFRVEPYAISNDHRERFDRKFLFGLANRDDGTVDSFAPPMDTRVLLTRLSFGTENFGEFPAWQIGLYGKEDAYYSNLWHGMGWNPSPHTVPDFIPYEHDPKKVQTMRIVRVGKQAEAFLNGRRLALVHVPESLNYPGVYLDIVGCHVWVSSLKADVLK